MEESITGQENETIECQVNDNPPVKEVNGISLEKRLPEVPFTSAYPVDPEDVTISSSSLPNESLTKSTSNEPLEAQDTEELIHRCGELEEKSEQISNDAKVEVLIPITKKMAAEDPEGGVDSLAGGEEQEKGSQLSSRSNAEAQSPQDEVLESTDSISVEKHFPVIDDDGSPITEAEIEASPESTTVPDIEAHHNMEHVKEPSIPTGEDTKYEHLAQTKKMQEQTKDNVPAVTQSAGLPEVTSQTSTADETALTGEHELNEDAKGVNIHNVEDTEDEHSTQTQKVQEQTKYGVPTVTQSADLPKATPQASTAGGTSLTGEHELNQEEPEESVRESQETQADTPDIPMEASLEHSLDGTGASVALGQNSSASVPHGTSGDITVSQTSTENTSVVHSEIDALPLQGVGQEEELPHGAQHDVPPIAQQVAIGDVENFAKIFNEARNESTAAVDREAEGTVLPDTAAIYAVENSAQESTDPGSTEAPIHSEAGLMTTASAESEEVSLIGEEVEEPALHNPTSPEAVTMNEFQIGKPVGLQPAVGGSVETQEITQEGDSSIGIKDVIGGDDPLHDIVPERDDDAIQNFAMEVIPVQGEALIRDEIKVEPLIESAEKVTGVTTEYTPHADERAPSPEPDVLATPSPEEGEKYDQELPISAPLDNTVSAAELERGSEASIIKEDDIIESNEATALPGTTKDVPPTPVHGENQTESEAFSVVDYVPKTEIIANVDDQTLSTTPAEEAPRADTDTVVVQEPTVVKVQVVPGSDTASHDYSISETPLASEPVEQIGSSMPVGDEVILEIEQVKTMEPAATETLEASEQVMCPQGFVHLLKIGLTCNTRSLPLQEF